MNTSRILVVDDEPQLRRAMRSTLSALGFIVDDADTGEAALERVREDKFDLILLDVNLPGRSGLSVCREIRERSDVNILMLTVRDRPQDKIDALDAGADGYVTKPFDVNELLARIRASLRRAPTAARGEAGVLRLDGLEINFRDRQVRVNGRVARLTPTELELLHYFVRNSDAVLPHEKILQTVWGPDYGNEVEYLRVFVNQLRKKIEPDPAHPRYILTEPWMGYRFNAECRDSQGSSNR